MMKIDVKTLTDLKKWLRDPDEDVSLTTLLRVKKLADRLLSDVSDELTIAYSRAAQAYNALGAASNDHAELSAEYAKKMRSLYCIATGAVNDLIKDLNRIRLMQEDKRKFVTFNDCCSITLTQQLVTELENF